MALDLTAPKAPPAKPVAKSTPAKTPGVSKSTDEVSNTRLSTCVETLEGLAGISALFGLHADAGLLMMHGGLIATTAVEMGKEHEKVGDAIDILGKNSGWVTLIGTVMVVGGQFAVNHGWIKHPERMAGAGIVTPDTLIAMSKTKLAEIEMAARQAQMDAEAKRQALQQRYQEMEAQREAMNGQPVAH